ncbi:hypothetical protein EVAR_54311_1 [Eumeta japonica]|uniref:Uncharacterized protein n=1 Tax=Eumeta variegata TaxID=151549 RepID=A0A4C1YXR5_EUMVA|nr:hypothetical protein EVAR_54311_1 [Eumeta japonica]
MMSFDFREITISNYLFCLQSNIGHCKLHQNRSVRARARRAGALISVLHLGKYQRRANAGRRRWPAPRPNFRRDTELDSHDKIKILQRLNKFTVTPSADFINASRGRGRSGASSARGVHLMSILLSPPRRRRTMCP